MSGDYDWLEREPVVAEETPNLPAVVDVPVDYVERIALANSCWSKLTDKQRLFLTAWRENHYNARAAARALGQETMRKSHQNWLENENYALIVKIWRGVASAEALNPDRLITRQDEIVEELLKPKPILYQGSHSGYEEVNATGAARANETLMKAAGLLKDKDIDVNVGIVGPQFTIQVMQQDGSVIDATPVGVTIDLPAPEEEWP